MRLNLEEGEKIILQATAVLLRKSRKYDGKLYLSNRRLQFLGIDQEHWSYSLGDIVSVKLKNWTDYITLYFSNESEEKVLLYRKEDWLEQILRAKLLIS